MIVLTDDAPRWLQELARFASIKNLLFIYGNVHDLVSFPIDVPGSNEIRWTESDLPGFFRRFLMGLDYEVVGYADPVEELSFATPEMEKLFHRVETGRDPMQKELEAQETHRNGKHDTDHELQSMASPPARGHRPEPADWSMTIRRITRGLQNGRVPCAFVVDLASRFTSSPDRLSGNELGVMTRFLKASLDSREVVRQDGRWNNLLILICDKMNDLPAFLYMNNPRARSISIEPPDRRERARFIRRYYPHFHGGDGKQGPSANLIHEFVDLTDGLSSYEMRSLVSLSIKEKLPIVDPETGISNIRRIAEMYKYGVTVSEWDTIESDKLANAEAFIRGRIKGQEAAVNRVLDIVKRAKVGLAAGEARRSNRPRGILFFAGPTGVGKTEMAKALAALLFGDEDRLIRFDMSEYSIPQSDQRLLGAPPGYVGYEEGGQLTNAVKRNPFSILLFDEIEKAHGSIFDKFLQILDDGRLTDNRGDTVYFSECIIIFTSNLGTVTRPAGDNSSAQMLVSPGMSYDDMREIILREIQNHFNFVLSRPEILNRIGENFVIFDFIKPPVDEDITNLLIDRLEHAAGEDKQLVLHIEKPARDKLVELARGNLHHGGRGIRNVLDLALVNPLSRALFDQDVKPNSRVRVVNMKDLGDAAAVRFQLEVAVERPRDIAAAEGAAEDATGGEALPDAGTTDDPDDSQSV